MLEHKGDIERMSKKLSSKLQLITKFLDPDEVDIDKLKNIDGVLKLELSAFKFLEGEDIKNIQKLFKVSKIKDLLKLNQEDPFKELYESDVTKPVIEGILKGNPELEELVKKSITISKLIELVKQKDVSIERETQKVIVLGLDNAGKTAIISKIGGRLGIEDLAELKPTKGVDFQKIETPDIYLSIWDFGGQEQYRNNHLSKEKNFLDTHLLMYVIDVQDPEKFDASFQYFKQILQILDRIEVFPYIIVLLHKYDPDIRNDPEISLQVELVRDIFKIMLADFKFEYEVYLSSIYSLISMKPKFSLSLKEILNDTNSFIYDTEATTEKVRSLGETIKKTLNAVIKLSEFCDVLEKRLSAFESGKAPQEQIEPMIPPPIGASPPPPPPPPPPTGTRPSMRGTSVRVSIINELKDMFAKKKELDLK
jgi:Arf/Sar family protein